MHVMADLVIFHVWDKECWPNHPYGPTVRLKWSEDECFCPAPLVRDYLARTKGREQISEKLFVTRRMGPLTAILNGTIASWLKKPLPWCT